uniref:Uncharacterized protein n=1 Tax=Candidatus Kentrum sp. LFY TaxID=2126342 RepID=A0A450V4I5_9GAMM|nr:MAG: hypothetical protein BECKLFY1418A_GA0070994_110312 [Candidatus Kentron sp. LFY]VFK00279.1 MAG: hypothetical protein BECKLFY1418B_GA0070995_11792 [Candidatus Kentron sp. LFY]
MTGTAHNIPLRSTRDRIIDSLKTHQPESGQTFPLIGQSYPLQDLTVRETKIAYGKTALYVRAVKAQTGVAVEMKQSVSITREAS